MPVVTSYLGESGEGGAGADLVGDERPTPRPAEFAHRISFPRCRVSTRAVKLVKVLRCALEYACSCDARSAAILYSRVRDVVDLFHAVSVNGGGMATDEPLVPHTTLLQCNDCLLLAHSCLNLGAEFGARLPQPLRDQVTFTDMFHVLSSAADEILERVYSAQLLESLSTIQEGGSFAAIGENADAHTAAQRAVHKLTHQLGQLQGSWVDVLPQHLAFERVQAFIDAILAELLRRLQALAHISERDSAIVPVLLKELCMACDRALSATVGSASLCETKLAPHHLRKCRQLEWILQARLSEVRDRYCAEQLELFRPRELLLLLQALYEQTTLNSAEQTLQFMRSLEANV